MCMRILLVEDDRTIAVGLVYALEQEGYAVHHVPDAAGGKLAAERPCHPRPDAAGWQWI